MIKDENDKREPISTDDEKGQQNPRGSGEVSDEDIESISGENRTGKTGQDHSLENYEDSEPRDGVGEIQNSADTGSDIAHFND